MPARLAFLSTVIALIAWIVVAFVRAVPQGWPHLFLVAAVGFAIYGIAKRDDAKNA